MVVKMLNVYGNPLEMRKNSVGSEGGFALPKARAPLLTLKLFCGIEHGTLLRSVTGIMKEL